jgi:hypothetical protein
MPAIDDNDGILLTRVPVGRTPTLAAAIGDARCPGFGIVLVMSA